MGLAGLNRADTAAVAPHDCEALKPTLGDGLADLAAYARALDIGDGPVVYHVDNRVILAAHRGSADGDVLDAELMDFFHNHVENLIALAEVVVEAQRHAVLDFAL